MITSRRIFRVTFPLVPEPVVDVWRTLVSILEDAQCLPKNFKVQQIAGHKEEQMSEQRLNLNASAVADLIIERDLSGFFVDTGYSSSSVCYRLTHSKSSGRESVLTCRIESKSKAPSDWSKLIEALISQWSSIGAWQWDQVYRDWQCCTNPSVYERHYGEIPAGLETITMKSSDGIGPDRKRIITAKNPGRERSLLPTIYFHPSSEMWLGPHFWQYAACTKEEALAADFWLEAEDKGSFVYLKSWHEPFWRPDGEQGRQQQKIWRLLFNEDCEWPPGSGGISDEPMYGPPELMPENR